MLYLCIEIKMLYMKNRKPSIKNPQPNTLYVLIHEDMDKDGKHKFDLGWLTNNIGQGLNEKGIRWQCFHAVLETHIQSFKNQLWKIEYIKKLSRWKKMK